MPLVASVPLVVNETAWLYQPLWSATRSGVKPTLGAVASYLRLKEPELLLPAASLQVPETPVPVVSGPAYVFAVSQVTPPLISSFPAKETETGALYQPL